MSLLRTAAGITVKLETMQAAIVNGDPVDTRLLIRLANSQARALRALGEAKAQPPAAPRGPSALWEHLRKMHAVKQAAASAQRGTDGGAGAPGAETK
jgi:hypothetical protein